MARDLPSRSVLVLSIAAALCGHPTATAGADAVEAVVRGNSAFAFDLYARLNAADANLCFSPWSISSCLAMAYSGARGSTAAQMAKTFHFDAEPDRLSASFGELQAQLGETGTNAGLQLEIANGLWAQEGHPFLAQFLQTAKQSYRANLERVDFRRHAEAVRVEINDWVSHKTKDKINNLIQPGVLTRNTALVLVNAIYFKGQWATPFDKRLTAPAPFQVTPTVKPQVPLMKLTAEFNYGEVEGAQWLELPYAGDVLSMVVFLPRASDGLPAMEQRLDTKTVGDWLGQGHRQKVAVFLPKFKFTAEFGLGRTLAAMGMADAFSPQADFSGMDGSRGLVISEVIHKAFIEVNEIGTEAAAATAVGVRSMVVVRHPPPPIFRADHPFLFLIRDTRSGSILFLGRVTDPR